MKKSTIKNFQQELQMARDEASKWYQKYSKLEEEQKIKNFSQLDRLEKENDALQYQVKNLLEIIRWEINPDTAKLPFTIAKSERDNNFNRY
jgi:hypothetical protein